MKKAILATLCLVFATQLTAQNEFETYENGLIYSEATMNKLEHIVDSLNLRYKTCDLNKVYKAKAQTVAHIVKLEGGNIRQAKKDLDAGISWADFLKKYPETKTELNVLVLRDQYESYRGDPVLQFREVDVNSNYGFNITRRGAEATLLPAYKGTWQYESSEAVIHAFFFPKSFESQALPPKYSRQIGYADCLIDTTTTKFKKGAESGWVELPPNWQKMSAKKQTKLLDEMRATRVVGGCSQDSRPREHAIHIALLSAETTNWETFLRSHLDIMNDRFDRMSDGSYAWAQRKTYIKELEELDINVQDLMMGISLRIENPAQNHYYGSIGRLGRAISESGKKQEFITSIRAMIEDTELDDYNRVLAYFLYLTYNNFLEDEAERAQNLKEVQTSIAKLPDYLKEKVEVPEK